jgi:hypothetical protein
MLSRSKPQSRGGGLAPWHMWGTHGSVTVLHPSSSATQFSTSQQLARINYKRPETWHFLFAAKLLQAPDGAPGNVDVIVDFDLAVGLGRTAVQLQGRPGEPGFCRLVFHYAGPASAQIGVTKWTTQTQTEVSNIIPATPVVLPLVEFVAQDIQCSVRVFTQSAAAVDAPTLVECHSYFAPKNHIRPDWFDGNYRGEEKEGT